jgi:hypothetical protein
VQSRLPLAGHRHRRGTWRCCGGSRRLNVNNVGVGSPPCAVAVRPTSGLTATLSATQPAFCRRPGANRQRAATAASQWANDLIAHQRSALTGRRRAPADTEAWSRRRSPAGQVLHHKGHQGVHQPEVPRLGLVKSTVSNVLVTRPAVRHRRLARTGKAAAWPRGRPLGMSRRLGRRPGGQRSSRRCCAAIRLAELLSEGRTGAR